MRPVVDERDAQILATRRALYDRIDGPRVGDWVLVAGKMRRFTYAWPDGLQTTCVDGESGSFYLGAGYVSYSGSLDHVIPREKLRDTGTKHLGRVWLFHHDHATAFNGVDVEMEFRVFEALA